MSERCSACQERDAVIRLTQVQDDQVVTLRLCERCAAERGLETGIGLAATPLGGFLAALGHVGPALGPAAAGDAERCPACGATPEEFRATGRVGCATCWDAFSGSLGPLVRRLHGSAHHAGRRYLPPGPAAGPPDASAERRRLTERLELAVATEDFEQAAELRDLLRRLAP